MQYHVKAKVSKNGIITIRELPFQEGDEVDVIVQNNIESQPENGDYPLRGIEFSYAEPFEGIIETDWDVMK